MPVAPAFPEAGPGRAHGAPLRTGIPAGNAAGCQPGVMQPESEDPDAGRRASASGRSLVSRSKVPGWFDNSTTRMLTLFPGQRGPFLPFCQPSSAGGQAAYEDVPVLQKPFRAQELEAIIERLRAQSITKAS